MTAKTRNLRHGEITIRDGSGTPKELVIKIAEGDMKWSVKRPSMIIKNRGVIDHRREGDQEAMDLSFSAKMEQWSYDDANTGLSPTDVILGTQVAKDAGWVSQDDCGDAWAVSIVFRMYDPCDANRETYEELEFPAFHADSVDGQEGSETNKLDYKGTSLATDPIRTFSPP